MNNKDLSVKMGVVTLNNLELSESLPGDWEDLFKDQNRLESLLFVGKYYRNLFDIAVFDCMNIGSYDEVYYLIDSDVLRDYLEIRSFGKLGSLAVDSLFYESSQKYGLPVGAFFELLDYLSEITRTASTIPTFVESADRQQSIRKIANFLNIPNADNLEPEENITEILIKLDTKALALTRLLSILTDPRFVGVISDYESKDAKNLERILSKCNRYPYPWRKGSTEKVDQRDGINLATVIKSVREARETKRQDPKATAQGYILISRTSVVLSLPELIATSEEIDDIDNADNTDNKEDYDFMNQLCDMLGVDKSFVENVFPVMHPNRVKTVELLGVYEDLHQAIARARSMRADWRVINDYFETQFLIRLSGPEDLYKKTLGPFLESERELVADTFKSIGRKMALPKSHGLYEIEERRSMSASIDYARQKQTRTHLTHTDEVRQRSTGFLNLLGQVLIALEDMPGFEYQVKIGSSDQRQPFQVMQFFQVPSQVGDAPIIFGEKYCRLKNHPEQSRDYYVLRWPVVCTMEEFAKVLQKIQEPILHQQLDECVDAPRLFLEPLSSMDSRFWSEGVVIYTPNQVFGAPLQPGGTSLLHIDRMHRWIENYLQSEVKDENTEPRNDFVILQYRINTRFGDFVFDTEPAEGDTRRYLSVISHYNLGEQIAQLYKFTGMLFSVPSKLANVLVEALNEFQDLPDNPMEEKRQ